MKLLKAIGSKLKIQRWKDETFEINKIINGENFNLPP